MQPTNASTPQPKTTTSTSSTSTVSTASSLSSSSYVNVQGAGNSPETMASHVPLFGGGIKGMLKAKQEQGKQLFARFDPNNPSEKARQKICELAQECSEIREVLD